MIECPECHVPYDDAFHTLDCSRRRLRVLETWCESLERRIRVLENGLALHEN